MTLSIADHLAARLGFLFPDDALPLEALTHKSYRNEHPECACDDNERLEFLGDAVLDLAISQLLFQRQPLLPEGELTRLRAEVVSEGALAKIGCQLELGALLRLGRGESRSGGREKPSLLANAVEALLGAVFLASGFAAAQDVVERLFAPSLAEAQASRQGGDFKTRLQELLQGERGLPPTYRMLPPSGPDHERRYCAEVLFADDVLGRG
ncbi:MAG: ribonuclease III, partial [Desulfuromonas sp.]